MTSSPSQTTPDGVEVTSSTLSALTNVKRESTGNAKDTGMNNFIFGKINHTQNDLFILCILLCDMTMLQKKKKKKKEEIRNFIAGLQYMHIIRCNIYRCMRGWDMYVAAYVICLIKEQNATMAKITCSFPHFGKYKKKKKSIENFWVQKD